MPLTVPTMGAGEATEHLSKHFDNAMVNSGLSVELCIKPHNRLADLILFLHAHRDSFASVQHCSMIPAPKNFSNFLQGGLRVAPSQIHRHLARECNIRGAPF